MQNLRPITVELETVTSSGKLYFVFKLFCKQYHSKHNKSVSSLSVTVSHLAVCSISNAACLNKIERQFVHCQQGNACCDLR